VKSKKIKVKIVGERAEKKLIKGKIANKSR
jgi:hypothetical protein